MKDLYLTWLLLNRSYQRVADHYGIPDRGRVYKRIRNYEAKLQRGCTCTGHRCWCG